MSTCPTCPHPLMPNLIRTDADIDQCVMDWYETLIYNNDPYHDNNVLALRNRIGYMSQWNMSNVTNIGGLFYSPNYGDDHFLNTLLKIPENNISNWNVSNVTNMHSTFYGCYFTELPIDMVDRIQIGNWNVSNVTIMDETFNHARLDNNISIESWDVRNVLSMQDMFANSDFNQDLKKWDINPVILQQIGEIDIENGVLERNYMFNDNSGMDVNNYPIRANNIINRNKRNIEMMINGSVGNQRMAFETLYNELNLDGNKMNFYYGGKNKRKNLKKNKKSKRRKSLKKKQRKTKRKGRK